MIIFDSLDKVENLEKSIVALGNFDGVHLGHQALIRKAKAIADENGYKVAVFTFSNHPKNFMKGVDNVKNIIYQDEKAGLLEDLGVDYLVNIEFNEEIMTMPAKDFVEKLLFQKLNAGGLVCGFNYRFGHMAKGDTKFLQEKCDELGIILEVISPVEIDDAVVSSTLIRGLIKAGEMEDVKAFLGRNYDIEGEVVVGNKLGKSIGFPTSNITLDEEMVSPPNGVYITYCIYNGRMYPSITNVGVKPTIGEFKKNMETHIFNFDRELYGKKIRIVFIKKTRDEVKFSRIDELVEQIRKDCENAKEYHNI
ncbi:MAG: bifunctional riboflavin kinase/FAD synthetase [Clostridia bacterium]|nr:bifunctional riboflavin kinase/FAD synthetase [Clostridia bacterium]